MVNFVRPQKSNSNAELWFNPVDKKIYETTGVPEHGFTSEINAIPIFDAVTYITNLEKVESAKHEGNLTQSFVDGLSSATIDPQLDNAMSEYNSLVKQNNFREAAMLATDNESVDVVKIHAQLYGLKTKEHVATALAKRIASEETILNFDKFLKMSGLEELGELEMPKVKNGGYERVLLATRNYGGIIQITDQAMRRNVHNPLEDSTKVLNDRVEQSKAFVVVNELVNSLDTVAATAWDTFVSGTDRSTNSPKKDLVNIVDTSIQLEDVGGVFSHMGVHTNGGSIYEDNSFIRGIVAPVKDADINPHLKPLAKFPGTMLVQDSFIPQEVSIVVDATSSEACCILLEGPVQIGSKVGDFLKERTYGVVSYHSATVLNKQTGRLVTGIYTALDPA